MRRNRPPETTGGCNRYGYGDRQLTRRRQAREELYLFGDVRGTIKSIVHHHSHFNWIIAGDMVVCESTSHGEHRDGPWRAGVPGSGAGRWCDVFEIRDFLIQRCFIYLDPDYAGLDTARYSWLSTTEISKS